jgi:hypothetical protein
VLYKSHIPNFLRRGDYSKVGNSMAVSYDTTIIIDKLANFPLKESQTRFTGANNRKDNESNSESEKLSAEDLQLLQQHG